MGFVERNADGKIISWFSGEQPGVAAEAIADDDPAVVAFLAPPSLVPSSCTKLGLKRAYDELGNWAIVKAAIAADQAVQEEWDLATELRRADPLVQRMIAALGLSDAQVDLLLTRANALV
ncbi:hypothetical protein [Bradyrhizobium sp. NAS96.2]|uniref:hypothetical protein n=1 Tax=Bradyrhizobium sp. NAS96.2 TaxID=1680160 RepID=UPI00093E5540|nr:hypothetical protein [Bradyrhizobium sp. NAS96.2]OKO67261.1 hypothetical protein AC628_39800 [Bradyrhizobium sp. NAS96.2]